VVWYENLASKEEKDRLEFEKIMLKFLKDAKTPEKMQSFSDFLRLDFKRIKDLPSGSCFLPEPTNLKDKVAVCKEGRTIKIFKLEEEKK